MKKVKKAICPLCGTYVYDEDYPKKDFDEVLRLIKEFKSKKASK